MKKIKIILACILACFVLIAGCTNQKGDDVQDKNFDNSVETDADTETGTEKQSDSEENSGSFSLPDGITHSFKDPDSADSIVVTPKG